MEHTHHRTIDIMAKLTVDQITEMLKKVPDKKLNEAITKGVLKLSDDEIDTLLFVFGLCYMAERDMETVLTKPWKKLAQIFSIESVQKAKELMNNFLSEEKSGDPTLEDTLVDIDPIKAESIRAIVTARYRPKSILDLDKLKTFGEKIRAYRTIFSNNNVAEILWVLKELRDDLSHGRIHTLQYGGVSLMERIAKEKILRDYLSAVNNPDHKKSRLKDELKLSLQENDEVKRIFGNL